MEKSLIESVIEIDEDYDLQIARMLTLLSVFGSKKSLGKIESISKFANLDFLLKNPVALKRILMILDKEYEFYLEHYEINSIETELLKFTYSPWDNRYRKVINIMEAKGLITIELDRKKVFIVITEKGIVLTQLLSKIKYYQVVINRAKIIKAHFARMSPAKTMNCILENIPESINLK